MTKEKELEIREAALKDDEQDLDEKEKALEEDKAHFDEYVKDKLAELKSPGQEPVVKLGTVTWKKKSGKKMVTNDRTETIEAAIDLGWVRLK